MKNNKDSKSTEAGDTPDTDPATEYLAFLRRHVGKPDLALLGSLAREARMGVLPSALPYGTVQYDTCMPDVCTKEELQVSFLVGVVLYQVRFYRR